MQYPTLGKTHHSVFLPNNRPPPPPDIDKMFPPAKACSPENNTSNSSIPSTSTENLNSNSNLKSTLLPNTKLTRISASDPVPVSPRRVVLNLINCSVNQVCTSPTWSPMEQDEHRRIVRFTRTLYQDYKNGTPIVCVEITATPVESTHSNLAKDPEGFDPETGLPYLEVSCMRCKYQSKEKVNGGTNTIYKYYMTSVEVVRLIQFITGTSWNADENALRIERGRLRSNLFPFWCKWTVQTRRDRNDQLPFIHTQNINDQYHAELTNAIVNYKYRRPRGFEKNVRVISWEKLQPALKRILQSYCYHP